MAHSGVYGTADAGAHWRLLLAFNVRALAVDGSTDGVIYAGTEPIGLFRSDDSGDTWNEVTGLHSLPVAVRDNWWTPGGGESHVRHICIHPQDPRVLYLALEHGGIVRSLDAGQTWEDVSHGLDSLDVHQVTCLGRDLRSSADPPASDSGPGHVYASTARGFFVSDNPASGWNRATDGITRDFFHDFTLLAPNIGDQSPTILLATAEGSPVPWHPEDGTFSARAAIFRSENGAESWDRATHGLPEELPAMVSCFSATQPIRAPFSRVWVKSAAPRQKA